MTTLSLRRAAWLALGLLLAGCSRLAGETPEALLSRIKAGLVERDARLTTFHLKGTVTEAGQEVAFEVRYRAPGRLLATLSRPAEFTFAYDGERYFELDPARKMLTAYRLDLPPQKAALFLAGKFAPFSPEGYRVPLLPRGGVSARRVQHPRAPEAVELRIATRDEGRPLTVTYVLRWPGLDFLLERTEAEGPPSELRVEAEHCEPALRLCFPERLTAWSGGVAGAVTHLSKVEVNGPLPTELFTLRTPTGYAQVERSLVDPRTP